ncbi:hypothetical protein ACJMK2_039196, partial [Sinanodonta woodiana]
SPTLIASRSEDNQAAVGAGGGIGVTILIVIIGVSVFLMLRRRQQNLAFAPKIFKNEIINPSYGLEPDNGISSVSFENDAVNIRNAKATEEPHNLTPHSINTGRDVSNTYDESMVIPRPRNRDNPHMNKF